MSGFWQLNGTDLTAVGVKIFPTAASTRHVVRQDLKPVRGGTEVRERLGKKLPVRTLNFTFLGRGTGKYDEMAAFLDVVEDDDVFTLRAPASKDVFAYRNHKRAAFSMVRGSLEEGTDAAGRITLGFEAIVNGVWIADSGTYAQPYVGFITRNTSSDYDTTGGYADLTAQTAPLIKVPEQTSGYPKAYNTTTFAFEEVSGPASTADEGGVTFEFYDMSNYVKPALSADGDSGIFELDSSPTADFLAATT